MSFTFLAGLHHHLLICFPGFPLVLPPMALLLVVSFWYPSTLWVHILLVHPHQTLYPWVKWYLSWCHAPEFQSICILGSCINCLMIFRSFSFSSMSLQTASARSLLSLRFPLFYFWKLVHTLNCSVWLWLSPPWSIAAPDSNPSIVIALFSLNLLRHHSNDSSKWFHVLLAIGIHF